MMHKLQSIALSTLLATGIGAQAQTAVSGSSGHVDFAERLGVKGKIIDWINLPEKDYQSLDKILGVMLERIKAVAPMNSPIQLWDKPSIVVIGSDMFAIHAIPRSEDYPQGGIAMSTALAEAPLDMLIVPIAHELGHIALLIDPSLESLIKPELFDGLIPKNATSATRSAHKNELSADYIGLAVTCERTQAIEAREALLNERDKSFMQRFIQKANRQSATFASLSEPEKHRHAKNYLKQAYASQTGNHPTDDVRTTFLLRIDSIPGCQVIR